MRSWRFERKEPKTLDSKSWLLNHDTLHTISMRSWFLHSRPRSHGRNMRLVREQDA